MYVKHKIKNVPHYILKLVASFHLVSKFKSKFRCYKRIDQIKCNRKNCFIQFSEQFTRYWACIYLKHETADYAHYIGGECV